jgi:hypothetical protein
MADLTVPPLPVVLTRLEWNGDGQIDYYEPEEPLPITWDVEPPDRVDRLVRKADAEAALASLQARLEAAERAMTALLPGPYYMDPPDGGSVTVLEQLQRMALDAKRYRWLRDESKSTPEPMREVCAVMFRAPFTDDPDVSLFGGDLDAAIDAATSQEKPAAPGATQEDKT